MQTLQFKTVGEITALLKYIQRIFQRKKRLYVETKCQMSSSDIVTKCVEKFLESQQEDRFPIPQPLSPLFKTRMESQTSTVTFFDDDIPFYLHRLC